jgi:phage shock protein A
MGNVNAAARRTEDKTAELHARASALDDLLASGALGDVAAVGDEQLQAQLDAITTQAAVEEELARIKERLASGAGQPGGDSAGDAPAAAEAPDRRRPDGSS